MQISAHKEQGWSGKPRPSTIIIPVGPTVPSLFDLEDYYRSINSDKFRIMFLRIVQPRTTDFSLDMCLSVVPSVVATNITVDKHHLADERRLCLDYVHHARLHGFKAKCVIYVDSHPGLAVIQVARQFDGDCLLLWAPEHLSRFSHTARDLYKYMIKHSPIPVTILPGTRNLV
ncbi:hypothetical protein FGIG_12107 [Fasciola gigantica]|uniref:UspA domain-containing protein n=1 Tax=Fasciola gigantica TaxID=46835 RepID=A0A504YQ36_FASGI|nr:hypothetical protein FGIG_12107 [Fasciola gigantica]